MALDIYMKYDMTSQIEQTISLMNESMDFRSGEKRTMWNEAIANEASTSDYDSFQYQNTSSMSLLDVDSGDPHVFLDGNEDNDNACCYWGMCFSSPYEEEEDNDNDNDDVNKRYLKILQDRTNQRYPRNSKSSSRSRSQSRGRSRGRSRSRSKRESRSQSKRESRSRSKGQ